MKLNHKKMSELFQSNFRGNYHKMGRDLDISASHAFRVLKRESSPGVIFFTCLIEYCNGHGLDYREYIFLPEPLTVCNESREGVNQ